jgi:GDP-mannose 6-dehydrogenase
VAAAIGNSDLLLVCVGAPSLPNGGIDLKYVRRVCEQIGTALRRHHGAPVVVVRSTMLPPRRRA